MDTSPPRSRHRGAALDTARAVVQPLATIEIDSVTPSPRGFTLTGQGSDRSAYRLDVHFDLPLDPRTRTVLGELLSQSDVTVYRSDTPPAASR
ncbi:MAG TPA: hypothetical protein VH439_03235 [Gemmatimonadales bacterium]|jgi:hypothetical protein